MIADHMGFVVTGIVRKSRSHPLRFPNLEKAIAAAKYFKSGTLWEELRFNPVTKGKRFRRRLALYQIEEGKLVQYTNGNEWPNGPDDPNVVVLYAPRGIMAE